MLRRPMLLAACLLALPAARGEPVPITYRGPGNETAQPDGATGGFAFPNSPSAPLTVGQDFLATKVAEFSIAPADSPDRASALPYKFAVELRDEATGGTALASFAGTLTGTFWKTGANLINQFVGPTAVPVALGGTNYVVSVTGFTAPTGYGDDAAGGITAVLNLAAPPPPPVIDPPPPPVDVPPPPAEGPPPAGPPAGGVSNTPEPGTLALAGAGAAAVAARRLRRK
jgi:hypothetical protein